MTVTYVTLPEVKNYLKINSTDHDARLSNLITYGCSVIESYCGRNFKSNVYTEIFDGGTSSVFLKNIPVNNVHQVLEHTGLYYQYLEGPTMDGSIIDRTQYSKGVSANGGFALDNRYKKFGLTSGNFGGSAYVSVVDSDDFWFDASSFCLEGHFRFKNFDNNQTLISQAQDANNYWKLYYSNTIGITFECVSGGVQIANVSDGVTTGYSANTFNHILFSRDDNNICRIFRDGTQISSNVAVSNTIPNFSAPVEIGRQNLTDKQYFFGHADEIRISLANARNNVDFAVQTYGYATDENTVLLLHFNGVKDSQSTIDSSRAREQYAWYPETGEVTKHVGEDTGRETLTILGPVKFTNYTRGLKITYNGGYDVIPSDIKIATLDYIKELHKGIESRAVSLQGESATAYDFTGGFSPHIRRVLDLYRVVM